MLLVLQRSNTFTLCFLVLWYAGRDGSKETQITLLKTAQKVPGGKEEERIQSVVIHPSNPAMRHFTAVLDPPAPLSHRRTCLDALAGIYSQHLQRSCTVGAAWTGTPSWWTWYNNHRAETPNNGPKRQVCRWTQHGMDCLDFTSQPNFLHFESFHSLKLLYLFVGEAHLVPFPLFHFSPNIASGMN